MKLLPPKSRRLISHAGTIVSSTVDTSSVKQLSEHLKVAQGTKYELTSEGWPQYKHAPHENRKHSFHENPQHSFSENRKHSFHGVPEWEVAVATTSDGRWVIRSSAGSDEILIERVQLEEAARKAMSMYASTKNKK